MLINFLLPRIMSICYRTWRYIFFSNNCSLTFRDICSCLRVQKELRVSITDLVLKLIGLLLESRTRCSSWIKHGFISERSYHVDIMAALLFRKRVDCFHCIGRLIYFIIKNVWTYAKKIYTTFPIMQRIVSISLHFFFLFFLLTPNYDLKCSDIQNITALNRSIA